jgi:hypothetical protein
MSGNTYLTAASALSEKNQNFAHLNLRPASL